MQNIRIPAYMQVLVRLMAGTPSSSAQEIAACWSGLITAIAMGRFILRAIPGERWQGIEERPEEGLRGSLQGYWAVLGQVGGNPRPILIRAEQIPPGFHHPGIADSRGTHAYPWGIALWSDAASPQLSSELLESMQAQMPEDRNLTDPPLLRALAHELNETLQQYQIAIPHWNKVPTELRGRITRAVTVSFTVAFGLAIFQPDETERLANIMPLLNGIVSGVLPIGHTPSSWGRAAIFLVA